MSDHQCSYIANGLRCRYPGTWSDSTTGGGPWYCTAHASGVSPTMAAAIVEQSHSYNPAEIARKAEAERTAARERWLAERGLDRDPFEPSSEYAERLRRYAQSLGLAAKRMP